MKQALRGASADISNAIAAAGTIVIGFAILAFATLALATGTVHTFANPVYTSVVASAMLIAQTLADGANGYARSQVADRFIGAVGIFPALGGLTVAPETGGPLRTVRMLLTGSELAVRISAGVLPRTLSGRLAVP